MKKIKRLLSLTLGFVGCLLAGVFALQTPTDKAEKVDAVMIINCNFGMLLILCL